MSDIQPTKSCRRCKASKSIDDFNLHKESKDGRQSWCKKCKSEYLAANPPSAERKERANAKQRARRATPEGNAKDKAWQKAFSSTPEGKAKTKTWRARYCATAKGKEGRRVLAARRYARPEVKAKQKKRAAAFRIANKESVKVRDRLRRQRERDKRRKSATEYRKKKKASDATWAKQQAEYHAEYRKRNRDKLKILSSRAKAKRRARVFNATVGDTNEIMAWEKTWRTAKSVACHWCKKLFAGKECHADHRIPLSKGGAHDIDNLVVACEPCNLSKCAKLPEVFNATLEQPLLFF